MLPEPATDWKAIVIQIARASSMIAVLVGSVVLAGWAIGFPTLASLIPNMSTMKINAALGLLLAGLSLRGALDAPGQRSTWRAVQVYGCAAAVALIGGLTLSEYLFGWNLGIDQPPLLDAPDISNVIGTSRMAPASALIVLLVGVALLLLDTRRGRILSRRLTYCALAVALLALVGYLYGVRSLYAIGPYVSIALHTALSFAVLCVGTLCARPERGVIAMLIGQDAGSVVMRRLLPAAVGLPLLLGWLRLAGERAGLYDTAFGLALFALSNVIVFATLVWRNALYLNRADTERRQAERRIQLFSEDLEQRVIERTAQLTSANQKLEQANLAKDRFLANMSHELRTPLNAVIGFTGTLLMRLPGPLTSAQEKQLMTIQSSAKHLLALINDVLDLSRIEAGKRELYLEPVVCQDVIGEVIDALRPLAATKGIGLTLDDSQPAIVLQTDRRALSQILLNLMNNAIKFTDRGEVRIELARVERLDDSRSLTIACPTPGAATERELELHADTDAVVIHVRDTGIGIRQADQAKLFQVFSQLDASASRAYEGTGLGLYLSRKLATMLDGQITFSSEYGQGSTFTLLLAVQPQVATDADADHDFAANQERGRNGHHPGG